MKFTSIFYTASAVYFRGYLKNTKNVTMEEINMTDIINTEVEKFKFHRKDIDFIVSIDEETFCLTNSNWSNSMRRAGTSDQSRGPNGVIWPPAYDGESIDKDFLEAIFTPFRKGIKGQFGLGLSIVKKTLNLMDYDITIKNEKKGVSFTITRDKKL